jgi:hypothetical protein
MRRLADVDPAQDRRQADREDHEHPDHQDDISHSEAEAGGGDECR